MNFILWIGLIFFVKCIQTQVVDINHIFYKALEFPDANFECVKQLNETKSKISEEWALKMLDASSKLPSGLLYGNVVDFGNYDECMEIKHEYGDNEVIQGKYCFGGLVVTIPLSPSKFEVKDNKYRQTTTTSMPIVLSICLPNACKPSDLQGAVKRLDLENIIHLNDKRCQVDTPIPYTKYDIFAICLFSTLGILVALCTCYDVFHQRKNQKPKHIIFISFSLYTNVRNLLKLHNNSSIHLSCLNGLRVISMAWVVLGHREAGLENFPAINQLYSNELKREPYTQYFQGAPLAVDTFLFITGCLITFHFLQSQIKPGTKFNLAVYYIHRYLRLTPALFGTYIFTISLANHIGQGPIKTMVADNHPCFKWWWSVFLYIQNYTNLSEICILPTWYLAMDMQIYILTPILLIPLVKWHNKAIPGLGVLILFTVVITAPITYYYKLQMLTQDYYDYYYYLTHTRLPAYLIGMMTGVILFRYRNKKFKISTIANLAIWSIILAGMGTIVFTMNDITYNFDRIKSSIYITLHRPLWAVGLGWITFASFKGYGGFINWFLSLPIFEVWSKLTYSMFLTHGLILVITFEYMRQPTYFSDYISLRDHWADLVITTGVSFVWVLLFESPMIVIEKAIFRNGAKKPRTDEPEDKIKSIN